jgi:hypothetical protein
MLLQVLTWLRSVSLRSFLAFAIPTGISLTALFVALHDRRPRLDLRARKGDWCKIQQSTGHLGDGVMFVGIIEVYNVSARSNAIRKYEFWCMNEHDKWETIESEYFTEYERSDPNEKVLKQLSNPTGLTLPPFSAGEVRLMGFSKGRKPKNMQVKIEIEDMFGKRYKLQVEATV